MSVIPATKRDQIKLMIGFAAAALAVAYYVYPYTTRNEQIAADSQRVAQIEDANRSAEREFATRSIESLRAEAAENRSTLTVMRRLVPTGNVVPALLEEVSTAARRAGLDVGGVTPEAVIPGEKYDTYRYTITIIGGYHQFGDFLANVGSLARIVAPVHFSIVTGLQGRPGVIKTSDKRALASMITLQTYVERTMPPKPVAAKGRSS